MSDANDPLSPLVPRRDFIRIAGLGTGAVLRRHKKCLFRFDRESELLPLVIKTKANSCLIFWPWNFIAHERGVFIPTDHMHPLLRRELSQTDYCPAVWISIRR